MLAAKAQASYEAAVRQHVSGVLRERLELLPIPLTGHSARVADCGVFAAGDGSFRCWSAAKDRGAILWHLGRALVEGAARRRRAQQLIITMHRASGGLKLIGGGRSRGADEEPDDMPGGLQGKLVAAEAEEEEANRDADDKEEKREERGCGEEAEATEAESAKEKRKRERAEERRRAREADPLFSGRLGHTKWVTGVRFARARGRHARRSGAESEGGDEAMPASGALRWQAGSGRAGAGAVGAAGQDRYVVTWGKDSTVVVWDSLPAAAAARVARPQSEEEADARCLLTLTGHASMVRGVLLAHDSHATQPLGEAAGAVGAA